MSQKSSEAVRVISTAGEAIEAAHQLAATWALTAADVDANRRVPVQELKALSRSGLLAITVPQSFGGAGLPTSVLIQVILILAAVDTSLTQVPQNHYDFVDTLLAADAETQSFFYGEILRGARFGNAIAEPGRPSRRELATTIVEDGEGYRLNGRKFFSTGALTAQWVPVFGKHADGRILTAYVDRSNPGLDVQSDWDAFGQRGTFSGTTLVNDVWVPRSHVVDRSKAHPAVLVAQFAGNQLIHAAIETGGAEGALRAAAELLADTGEPYGADLARLGEFSVRVRAAQALTRRAARLVDEALAAEPLLVDAAVEAFMATDEAKSLAYELASNVANVVPHFRVSSKSAARRTLDRHWRNVRTHSLHDPVRWRQFYVGDFKLNGNLPPDVDAMVRRSAII